MAYCPDGPSAAQFQALAAANLSPGLLDEDVRLLTRAVVQGQTFAQAQATLLSIAPELDPNVIAGFQAVVTANAAQATPEWSDLQAYQDPSLTTP